MGAANDPFPSPEQDNCHPLIDAPETAPYNPRPMNITVTSGSAFSQKLPVLILGAYENEHPQGPSALKHLLVNVGKKEFNGAAKQQLLLHTAGQLTPQRLLLTGLGKRAEANHETLRRAVGSAVKKLLAAGLERAAIAVPDTSSANDAIADIVDAAILASYKYTEFKPDNDNHTELKSLTLCLPARADQRAAKQAVTRAQTIAESTNFARGIADRPGNVVYPEIMADYARQLAKECGLKCTIFDKPALTRGKFGGLLAVGGGSAHDPRLIVLEYNPPTGKRQAPVAIVGKAITFDSGGISIKPSDKMDEMKFDKCGGVATLGALRAIAKLKLPVPVLGIIASAENLPSATSYRPGDIVTSYPGKDKRGITIEILNTDAEGRVVLGDAVSYARERNAQAIIDLATLTGACVVALGEFAAGLFSNNEKLPEKIKAAAHRTGERVWPLPMWQEYWDKIKSDVADHKNTGGRYGGAITGAAFIGKYAADTPWAHIDIAGTAWTATEHPYLAKGATGFGVRLLAELLSHWS